jgi:hypothetical protein
MGLRLMNGALTVLAFKCHIESPRSLYPWWKKLPPDSIPCIPPPQNPSTSQKDHKKHHHYHFTTLFLHPSFHPLNSSLFLFSSIFLFFNRFKKTRRRRLRIQLTKNPKSISQITTQNEK